MSFAFRPAASFTDRHGVFVGLSGGTNAGKTFSALRLARGIAGPKGKIAVADTEGGRTLHLKRYFEFDANVMDPPFRPARFAEAAKDAEDAGYDVLLIDSASMEWRGLGGVLEWQEEEFARMGGQEKNKLASWIKPKMAHKAMVYSLLQRRIPIIFSLRAEEKVEKKGSEIVKRWAPVCNKEFPFELTVSFMLQADNKGFIDLTDPKTFKMEGAHKAIFQHGQQLGEEHGAALAAWAIDNQGQQSAAAPSFAADPWIAASEAAEGGKEAFTAWWNDPARGKPLRHLVKGRLAELQAIAAKAGTVDQAEEDPFKSAEPETAAPVAGEHQTPPAAETSPPAEPDDWGLLDASAWLNHVYLLEDELAKCTNPKAISVMQATPKWAAYHAMAKHAPASKEAVDKMIADRRKALS